jgi:hypothetical protein
MSTHLNFKKIALSAFMIGLSSCQIVVIDSGATSTYNSTGTVRDYSSTSTGTYGVINTDFKPYFNSFASNPLYSRKLHRQDDNTENSADEQIDVPVENSKD